MTDDLDAPLFEDDPVLGQFIAHYPSNRLRLLIIAGLGLAVVWFIITIALWQVDDGIAAILTVIVLAIATLGAGWYVTHFWNREVVLYHHGFTYREGASLASLHYVDVVTIRQRGEQRAYFGGLIRRSALQFTMLTDQDETIVLTNLYRRLEDLTIRLEKAITAAQRQQAEVNLTAGQVIHFSPELTIGANGLHVNGETLLWDDVGGFTVQAGNMVITTQAQAQWYTAKLSELDNLRLLVSFLRERPS